MTTHLRVLLVAAWLLAAPAWGQDAASHRMTDEDLKLCAAALREFGAEPERIAVVRSQGRLYGESDRRDGGTCNQYGLWAWRQGRWVLVVKAQSLDPRAPSATEAARLARFRVTPEVRRALGAAQAILLDAPPERWDLDVGYKVRRKPAPAAR